MSGPGGTWGNLYANHAGFTLGLTARVRGQEWAWAKDPFPSPHWLRSVPLSPPPPPQCHQPLKAWAALGLLAPLPFLQHHAQFSLIVQQPRGSAMLGTWDPGSDGMWTKTDAPKAGEAG